MSTRVVDRVDDWSQRSFSGGYRELSRLADDEFSGVVRAAGAELYMTRGVVVGIRQGSIDDFEEGQGTIYEAPSDALPLLAVMQERNEEVRDKFYTEKTPISDVDKTLSDGGFTGYVELSENVLSGDYYLVYHGGRSMSVGFVGESARLIKDDKAFETADDEVGIYKVRPVDVDRIEIPEPTGSVSTGQGTETTGGSTGGGTRTDEPSGGSQPSTTVPGTDDRAQDRAADGQQTARRTPGGDDQGAAADSQETVQEPTEGRNGGGETGADERERAGTDTTRAGQGASDQSAQQTTEPEPTQETGSQPAPQETRAEPEQEPSGASTRRSEGQATDQTTARELAQPSQEATDADQEWSQPAGAAGASSGGAAGDLALEQRAIPSLDPTQTREVQQSSPGAPQEQQSGGTPQEQPATTTESSPSPEPRGEQAGAAAEPDTQPTREPAEPAETVDPEVVDQLEAELDQKEAEVDRLESELDAATAESAHLRDQLDSVREERDALEEEVERLETERRELESDLERLETELGASADVERRITGEEALSGTDVFVRYFSKGEATLEKAHGGSTRKEAVHENLRLEKHTQFDADSVAVGRQTYAEYLDGTVEYQFVEWLVRELLFEVRETGHEKKLKDLYNVLPAVDRAELAGVVEAEYTADGQPTRSQEAFDIILRDRMGNPLLVANLNDSREAATEGMMEDLITSAERVGQTADEFAGAFLVTRSFFDPGALEVAEQSTQGGLFSRDKRKSFVNLSRKQGYHLCLVEARNENFHLAVPEL